VEKDNGRERNTLTPGQYRELQHSFAAQIMHDPKITPAFLKVAWAYCLHINSETGAAWPKIKTITDLTGVCGKTVSRARKYFGLKWHVTEERRPGKSLICYPQPKDVPGQQDVSTHGTDPGQVVVPTGVDNKMSRGSGQQDVHRLLNTQRLTLNRGLLIEGFARTARRTARSRSQKRRKRLGEEARTTKAWTPSISSRPRLLNGRLGRRSSAGHKLTLVSTVELNVVGGFRRNGPAQKTNPNSMGVPRHHLDRHIALVTARESECRMTKLKSW
jgi:hypothetical protein